MHDHFGILYILTVGLTFAAIFGYLAQRLHFSPILGYLIAGYIIGPFSPGFVADLAIAEQLAEVGVILMLFGVGMHFKLEDLVNVKNIAIPGALVQTASAAIVTTLLMYSMGWTITAGLITGLSVGVASTVVLVRILTDNRLLNTLEGHIAVGWLVVEDIFTVFILILLPTIATFASGESLSAVSIAGSVAQVLAQFALLVLVMFTFGQWMVAYLLTAIARLRSQELFTLGVVALVFLIAISAAVVFGMSIPLGAFIAGMVIGNTSVRHQAAANALPLKDIFAVIFFLAVGMLFNPNAIFDHFGIFISILAVILLLKPFSAWMIAYAMGYSMSVALTVALALAQIGEFSFILAEEALNYKLLPDEGYDTIVACALVSIALNPLLFKLKNRLLPWLDHISTPPPNQEQAPSKTIVVGFGPTGREVARELISLGHSPVVIEENIDTVTKLENDLPIIFGDAARSNILNDAHIKEASHLFITLPDTAKALEIIHTARQENPAIQIVARIQYIKETNLVDDLNIHFICTEQEALHSYLALVRQLL